MRRNTVLFLGLGLGLLAAACASHPVAPPPDQPEPVAAAAERRALASRPTYNLTGYPAALREGYIDGCESAKHSDYARKDGRRVTEDPQYAMGWNDGFAICNQK